MSLTVKALVMHIAKLLLVLPLSAALGTSAVADDVTVRATTLLDEAIDYIARNSVPTKEKILPNELPEHMIARRCGSYTETYGAAFFQLNSNVARTSVATAREVSMPACIKWRRDVDGRGIPVGVIRGEILDDLVRRVIGTSKDNLFVCGTTSTFQSRCDQPYAEIIRKLNPGKNLEDLKEGDTVNVPLRTTPTTFTLKPEVTGTDAVATIKRLGKHGEASSGLISVQEAPELQLVSPAENVGYKDCNQAQSEAKSKDVKWPYDAELLTSVLKRTLALSNTKHNITVAVIDSGIAEDFPAEFLHKPGFGSYIADQIRPFSGQDLRERMHGTQVAHIASGGSGLRSNLSDLDSIVRISPVKVFRPVPTISGITYRIQSGDLSDGLMFAIENAHISNISISSSRQLNALKELMGKYPMKLFVVAAGNDNRILGVTAAAYPAGYGGSQGAHIITVAAHDAALQLARFSNRSSSYVDITAPGCDVPYRSDSAGVHGTSFAAPLVSLTSALLMYNSLGLHSAADVKDRIIASADYDPLLKSAVRSSSRLNIVKALSLYDDVVELKTPTNHLLFGEWGVDNDFQLCADPDESPSKEDIRKITVTGPNRVRALVLDKFRNQEARECNASPVGFTFKTIDGTTRSLTWDDIRDLVPARWAQSVR